MQEKIVKQLQNTKDTIEMALNSNDLHRKVEELVGICCNSLRNGGKIIFCGNGGSAADSQHLAAELVSRFSYDRPALHGLALTTDTSALTAIGNDYGYLYSFSRQVEAVANKGDVLIGFSTSGRSKNIIEAFKSARNKGVVTVGMLGEDGRDIAKFSDHQINIPSDKTPNIQEGHITIGHILCSLIEDEFFEKTHKPK